MHVGGMENEQPVGEYLVTSNHSVRTLRVAAVQMESRLGDTDGNLRRAEDGICEAAERGARLVLLPEFFNCGYAFSTELWSYAELRCGRTVGEMARLACRLRVFIGYTFLEQDGAAFYNTFVLACPNGTEHLCRKTEPAALEAFVFGTAPFGPWHVDK